jgi:hypothetical protein
MKKILFAVILPLLFAGAFVSCDKDDDDNDNSEKFEYAVLFRQKRTTDSDWGSTKVITKLNGKEVSSLSFSNFDGWGAYFMALPGDIVTVEFSKKDPESTCKFQITDITKYVMEEGIYGGTHLREDIIYGMGEGESEVFDIPGTFVFELK